MAQYEVTFSCGHTESLQLTGPLKQRQRRLGWYRESGLCSACYRRKKEQEKQEARKAAEQRAQELGLPPLCGTEQQIAWAEEIRLSRIHQAFKVLAEFDKPDEVRMVEDALDHLREQAEAAWWIERRNWPISKLLAASPAFRKLAQRPPYRDRFGKWLEEIAEEDATEAEKAAQRQALQELRRRGRELFGEHVPIKIGIWQSSKRLYVGRFGANYCAYYHDGDAHHDPGELELFTNGASRAKQLGMTRKEFKERILEFCRWACTQWQEVRVTT